MLLAIPPPLLIFHLLRPVERILQDVATEVIINRIFQEEGNSVTLLNGTTVSVKLRQNPFTHVRKDLGKAGGGTWEYRG